MTGARLALPPRRHHRAQTVLLAVVVIAVVLTGAAFAVRAWLTMAPSRVSVGTAVDRYRSSTSAPAPSPAGTPAPGVYVYTTSGRESVDALGGDTHDYPNPFTTTVTATACGFDMTWAPLSGRSDTTHVCTDGAALRITAMENAHEFFRITQIERFTCDATTWWLPPPGTTSWTSTCRSDTRTEIRTAHVVDREPVVVGGSTVAALHVHRDDVVTGDSTGTSATDLWLDATNGLLLREHSSVQTGNDTAIGHVTFHEDIELDLDSKEPLR